MTALLCRFDGSSRFLARVLLRAGARGAWTAFNKLRCVQHSLSLCPFLHTLCQDEAMLEEETRALTTVPLVSLFSDTFKRDLLCFLHMIYPAVPQDSALTLLHCLSQERKQKPWICALISQLRRDIGDHGTGQDALLTPKCTMDLKALCDRFRDSHERGGPTISFNIYLNEQRTSEFSTDNPTDLVNKKRKSAVIDLTEDNETVEPLNKKMKMDLLEKEHMGSEMEVVVEEEKCDKKMLQSNQDQNPQKPEQLVEEGSLCTLPDHIKGALPLIKELLESGTEWDESSMPTLKVFNECDVKQMELLCETLHLADAPEHFLPNFCSLLLALTPDLSHSTASIIVKNLLLGKVLSLSEPASRSLVIAVTSLCSRYPRPTCQMLIQPLIKEEQTGGAQAELLCRVIKECLEPQYRLLVFQMLLEVSWNEGLLSVIHTLLDSKIELSEEMFSSFINQLSNQCPLFAKSMKFSKMMLTVLTKYHSQVNAECQHTLYCCITSTETFLKKSLQAALKRISH